MLPKHWWEGTDKSGKKRDIGATTLEPPLGCGAYRIKEFVPGRTIVYERVKDYWGKDLNVNIGRDNFDELRYEYFRDTTVALEAFKADQVDWRTENSAKNWATAYDFPAVKDKRVILEEFPIRNRRDAGLRVQHAARQVQGPAGAARVQLRLRLRGDEQADLLRPVQAHRQLLRGHRARLRRACRRARSWRSSRRCATRCRRRSSPRALRQSGRRQPENVRANLREAVRLLQEAGYEVRDRKLVNVKTGEPLTVEFLIDDPNSERFVLFYKPSLERLGIDVTVRTVDDAQYENRLRSWDFDMIIASWGAVAVARQRAARLLGLAGRRPAGLAQLRRHQESGGRCADRARDLRQGSRRAGRRHQGARPRAAVESLRRAAMDLRQSPHGALGPLRPADPLPKYGLSGFPTIWWWDAKPRRQDVGRDLRAMNWLRMAWLPRRDAGHRRRRARVARSSPAAPGSARRGAKATARRARTASRPSATSNIRPTSRISTTSIRMRRRAACSRRSARHAAFNQNFLTFNSLNSYILKGDARAGHGADLRHPDGARAATSRTRCTASRRARCASRPTADLSLPAAAGGAASTTARR